MNLFNDIEELKRKKEIKKNIEYNNNNDNEIKVPFLLYTEYTCPYFNHYWINNTPYLFKPSLSFPIYYSNIIEFYLQKDKLIINPDISLFDSTMLVIYIKELNKIEIAADNNSTVITVFEINNNIISKNLINLKEVDNSKISHAVEIINLTKTILFNTNEEIIDIIPPEKLKNFTFFCSTNKCPYYHICKYKDRLY